MSLRKKARSFLPKLLKRRTPKLLGLPGGAAAEGQYERLGDLARVSLFEELHDSELALQRLAQIMVERRYSTGDIIIEEGSIGTEMFVLTEGTASVFKRTAARDLYKVAILSGAQHAFFGEGAMLETDARSATIRADSECRCLVLEREAFLAFCSEHPEWGLPVLVRIAKSVMTRLKKMNGDLTLIYNALVEEIRGR